MLKIVICDLTHVGATVANENIPLGAGFIFAHARKMFGDRVALSLIKYPAKLDVSLEEGRPDVVAFANYVWNNDLNEHYCRNIKARYPDAVIVKGGPNFPVHEEDQIAYARRYPSTDAYIEFEGEIAFDNLIQAVMDRGSEWNTQPINGVYIFSDKAGASPSLMKGLPVARITNLDEAVPSPYLSGYLDEFFDGRLTPIIQRTRGCPFTCNFCNEGGAYYNKINKFSVDRIVLELRYIGERAQKFGIRNLFITDMNFGMYEEDFLVAQEIADCKRKYGWPITVLITTGKNRIDRVSKAVEVLGDSVIISMSMQSTSEPVLNAIRRKNIKPEMYISLTSKMPNQPKMAELIVPLPQETFESYLESVRFLVNAGVDKVLTYTLQINLGTEYDSKKYLDANGYQTRYRAYANCFGNYGGETVLEAEEVGVATNCLPEADYYRVRKLAFIIELVFNNSIFREFFRFLSDYAVKPFDFLYFCFEESEATDSPLRPAIEAFLKETQAELFDTPEALLDHYRSPANYQRLANGEEGRNVLFSNKAQVMAAQLGDLVEFLSDRLVRYVRLNGIEVSADEIGGISHYSRAKLHDILNPAAAIDEVEVFQFDIPAWLKSDSKCLGEYSLQDVRISFYFDDSQIAERKDAFSRYGSDVAGAMKIFARIANHQRLVRCVRYAESPSPGRR